MFKKFKNSLGFTLVEMLIVLLIIAVLIILIVPNLGGRTKEVNEKGCLALKEVVHGQVQLYYIEHGSYPEDLNTLISEGYITESQTTCANKQKIIYSNGNVSISNE